MINTTNHISAKSIRILALIVLRLSSSFRAKFKIVKQKITEINRDKTLIPQSLILSLIIIEDKRYYNHLGIDFYSILRAIYRNTITNRREGASTIVQQLIRNIINEREITVDRKVNEIMLAVLISMEFSKNEIMFAYLNTYNFNNCVGVCSLCSMENYDIENLSYNDAAQIAARFKYPSITKSNYIKYLKRVRTIEKKHMSIVSKK